MRVIEWGVSDVNIVYNEL